ncbi:U6 snRNA-associated Sm-like protein LSm2 [Galdieria sulphuraria]|nr:U6 snRNA-associated Sm-like protein LSm2 [Galdieria sulphuraria]
MLFFSFFKTFIGKTVTVELKNDVIIRGKVHSVDQYLNIKLEDIEILNVETCPQLMTLKNSFIRGSVIRYIQVYAIDVDCEMLQEATRREYKELKKIAK